MKQIHPTAIIHDGAQLGKNVLIGPFCIIGPDVKIGNDCELKSHVVIEGDTEIGDKNIFFPFASIGQIPQITKYSGEKGKVIIGNNNIIREYVTIQSGSLHGGMKTVVGNNGLFMVGVHIAHDCIIGNNVIFANYVSLGGHVEVGDFAIIGGLAAVHQFVKIGAHSMIGGLSGLAKDLIPFGLANNDRANLEGLNLVGMKRRGFDNQDAMEALNTLDDIFTGNENFNERVDRIKSQYKDNKVIQEIVNFLKDNNKRGFCTPKK